MFLFYVDESGNRNPPREVQRPDGTTETRDWLYVLTAVSLFEHQWHGFEKTINRHKAQLMVRIHRDTGIKLQLADCEIKSNWTRIPRERAERQFLANLSDSELTRLIDLYYEQLDFHNMHIFSVVVDKRALHEWMDHEKLHRKAWELLLEQVERVMRARFHKHQAIMVNDDIGRYENRALAMKHAFLLDQGTKSNMWLKHICEMPMFVRSELSNGVQLADLCSYNIYRAFSSNNLDYPFFERIRPFIWSRLESAHPRFSGIRVFPDGSPLEQLVDAIEKKTAPAGRAEAGSD